MRVVVTGGAGHIGNYVYDELRVHGHTVIPADQKRPEWGGPHKLADFTKLGEAYGALHGADAVLHLAAIPFSGVHPNEFVFGNNVMSTFNVFEAAAGLGIPKVVQASSFTTLGFSRWVKPFAPAYVPIDEALDAANAFTSFEDPADAAAALAPYARTTHIKDFRIDALGIPGKAPWIPVGCALGEGNVDNLAIIELLEREAPDPEKLPLIVEVNWPPEGADATDLIVRNVGYLREHCARYLS